MGHKTRVMYIEQRSDGERYLDGRGPAVIARVTYSKTGATLYYRDLSFQRMHGIWGNYVCLETDDEYWISGPKKDSQDTLYPGVVEIDEDVREEYWTTIRKRPDLAANTSYRSLGKHHRRSG